MNMDMNIIRLFLIGCLVCLATTALADAAPKGDVTGDGMVDIADVNAVINAMLGK